MARAALQWSLEQAAAAAGLSRAVIEVAFEPKRL